MLNILPLNIFPNLLDYWMIAPVILRAALGLAFIHEAYAMRKNNSLYALVKLLTALCLLVGFFTQLGALAALIITGIELLRRSDRRDDRQLFKLVIAIALLLLGPGWLSIDLPL